MDKKILTLPPPLGPTSATFEPGANFSVIPCNIVDSRHKHNYNGHHASTGRKVYVVILIRLVNDCILYSVMKHVCFILQVDLIIAPSGHKHPCCV